MEELPFWRKLFMVLNSGGVRGLFVQALLIAAVAGLIYIVFRFSWIKKRSLRISAGNEILRFLFVCYLAALFYLLFVPSEFLIELYRFLVYGWTDLGNMDLHFFTFHDVNFVPTIVLWLKGEITLGSWVKTMLVGNLLMFVPLGVFLPLIFERFTRRNAFRIAVFLPLAIEVFQPVVGRSFDVDDLILNFLGIVLGYWIGTSLKKLFRN